MYCWENHGLKWLDWPDFSSRQALRVINNRAESKCDSDLLFNLGVAVAKVWFGYELQDHNAEYSGNWRENVLFGTIAGALGKRASPWMKFCEQSAL